MADVLVETFELEELTTDGREAPEVEAVALQLSEELGLEGQRRLITKVDEEDPGTRNPYPQMTAEEQRVYETICAVKTELTEYDAGIIPVRVLQVVAHAVPLFPEGLQVWHPGVVIPDPLLVGIRVPVKERTWEKKFHLLARWGAELAPFEELRERAGDLLRRRWTATAEKKLRECEGFMAALDANVEMHLSGQYVAIP
jgi:hypothetical protein